jgi:hypothetical protein
MVYFSFFRTPFSLTSLATSRIRLSIASRAAPAGR